MATCITIEMLNHTFRGRAADQLSTTWPPSPVRLVGALLQGAHALEGAHESAPSGQCALARQALHTITAAPAPLIFTPDEPVELNTVGQWFTPRNAYDADSDDEGDKNSAAASSNQKANSSNKKSKSDLEGLMQMPDALASANRISKARTVSLLPLGNVIRFHIEADIADQQQWQALNAAAAAVPFFGSSTDHAQISIERVNAPPEPFNGEHMWRPVGTRPRRGCVAVRGWTADTVEWFDDNHGCGRAPTADWRVSTTVYARWAPRTVNRDLDSLPGGPVQVLPLSAPITLRAYAERVAAVDGWADADIFPALEFNAPDRVRGFGLYGPRLDAALDAAPEDLRYGAEFPGSNTSWEPATWTGPSTMWHSATPSAAHRDARVARKQLDLALRSRGLRLTALSAAPFTRWHSRRLDVPGNYGLWFLTAEVNDPHDEPIAGPLQIGECLPAGAGLLTPSRSGRRTSHG